MICHYWFFNHWCKFQDSVCIGCHDLTILCLNVSDNAIITVKNVDYHCIIHDITKFKAINLLKILFLKIVDICENIALISSLLKAVFFFYFFGLTCTKWLIVNIVQTTRNLQKLVLEQ